MTDTNQIQKKCREAIAEGKESLKAHTLEDSPADYASACNNIGSAYGTLTSISETPENKAENCKHAIAAFEEALKVYTLKEAPVDYAKTHSNLGNACAILASVENKDINCIKAFQSFLEAFKVFNSEDYPDIFRGLIENIQMHLPVCEKLKRKLDELFNAPKIPPSERN